MNGQRPRPTTRTLMFSTFRLDEDIVLALRDIKDREGIPATEQVRRALRAWIKFMTVRSRAYSEKGLFQLPNEAK